jgi:hypothetical protein
MIFCPVAFFFRRHGAFSGISRKVGTTGEFVGCLRLDQAREVRTPCARQRVLMGWRPLDGIDVPKWRC